MRDDSWMSYLQPFPFAKIKIDRSFVNDIAENVGSIKSLAAIAALAQELRIQATTPQREAPRLGECRDTLLMPPSAV